MASNSPNVSVTDDGVWINKKKYKWHTIRSLLIALDHLNQHEWWYEDEFAQARYIIDSYIEDRHEK